MIIAVQSRACRSAWSQINIYIYIQEVCMRRGVGRPTEHHLCAECDSTRLSCAAKIGTAARARAHVCVNQAAVTQLSRAERDFRAGSRPLIMRPKGNARCAQSWQNVSAIYRRNGTGIRSYDAPLSRFLRDERDSSEFIRKSVILGTKNKVEECGEQNKKLWSVKSIFVSNFTKKKR